MHLDHPPALVFTAPNRIFVISPLFMWFFEWLSFPLDCKVYAKIYNNLCWHTVGAHQMNEWMSHCFKLTSAARENPDCYHCLILLARPDINHHLVSNYVFHLNISKQDKNKQLEIANKKGGSGGRERDQNKFRALPKVSMVATKP